MCKNAGKTTALNALIAACDAAGDTLGLTSIGRDGERSDIVTNTKKPEIYVRRGTVIATAEGLLDEGDISKEIIDSTGINTPMGEIIILRAMSDGFVQLGGPSITESLTGVRDSLLLLGCDRVLIDGAISRKSLGTPQLADGIILCSGASYNADVRITVEDTVYIASLFSLPEADAGILHSNAAFTAKYTVLRDGSWRPAESSDELIHELKAGAEALVVRGAVTDKTAAELLNGARLLKDTLIISEDASRMLLSNSAFQKLKRFTAGFAVLKAASLLAVTVNPFSAYGNHYDKNTFTELTASALIKEGLDLPVINVTDVQYA